MFIETVIIAAVVALGLMVGGAALLRALVISRRPPHHLATRSGERSIPPTVDLKPPE